MSDRLTFALALMLILMVTLSIIAICAAVVGWRAFSRTERGAAKTFSMLVQRSGALQLLTVVTIVMSVLILAIIEVLDSAAAVSILSGIAGYVLGTRAGPGPAPAAEPETLRSPPP
jgi:hypothetical protein